MSSGYEPRLTEPLKASCLIREGQPVKLSCRFDAYPKAEIQWLKDGIPIDFASLGISRDFKVRSSTIPMHRMFYSSSLVGCEGSRLHCSSHQRGLSRRYRLVHSSHTQSIRRSSVVYSIGCGRILLSNAVSLSPTGGNRWGRSTVIHCSDSEMSDTPCKPVFVQPLLDTILVEGQKLKLHAAVRAHPEPEVSEIDAQSRVLHRAVGFRSFGIVTIFR